MNEWYTTFLMCSSKVTVFVLISTLAVPSQVTTIRVLLAWMKEEGQGNFSQVVKKALLMERQPIREVFLFLTSCLQLSVSCS